MILRVSLLAAILASLAFSPAAKRSTFAPPNTPEPAFDSIASTSSFYTFRRDLRRCASPRCGGYFVKLVNKFRTRCADGRSQAECYVAEINWGRDSEQNNERALLRGSLRRRGQFGVFRVTEVWEAAGPNQPADKFFRVRDRGLRCIAAPCASHSEATLNSTASRNIAGVDLSTVGAPDNLVSDATEAMTSRDGILATGDHTTVTGPAGRMPMLKANQFYLRADRRGSGGGNAGNPGGNPGQKPCKKTGCSGQVCADEDVVTTCEYRTEYDCYKRAACERQRNGECGFTMTPQLSECLRRARGN